MPRPYEWAPGVVGESVLLTLRRDAAISSTSAEYTDQWNRRWTATRSRGRIKYEMVPGEVPNIDGKPV